MRKTIERLDSIRKGRQWGETRRASLSAALLFVGGIVPPQMVSLEQYRGQRVLDNGIQQGCHAGSGSYLCPVAFARKLPEKLAKYPAYVQLAGAGSGCKVATEEGLLFDLAPQAEQEGCRWR